MEFQHAYSDPFRGSDLLCEDPSLAQQSFKDDADINVMLERFRVTGIMPQGVLMPSYGDFSGVSDYRTAREAILRAEHAFMDMPANVRSRFDNDPQRFLEFCADPKNAEEAKRLGLVVEKAEPSPMPVHVVGGIGGVAPDGEPKAG